MEKELVTRYFAISWPAEFGPAWMNRDNLNRCIETPEHVGEDITLYVEDVTDPEEHLILRRDTTICTCLGAAHTHRRGAPICLYSARRTQEHKSG